MANLFEKDRICVEKLKIGILTFHRCINYGSYWQTRCLVEGLRSRGHQAEILDHHSGRVNVAEWKCAMRPILPTPSPASDYILYKKKIKKFFNGINSLPLSPPFRLEHPQQMNEYDMVVVGSDEVWNLSHPWYGYYPIFYGDGVRARRLVSYAASFGNYDVTWKPDQEWVDKLRRFEKISVRDENSKIIIKRTLGFEPETTLDPCLQFPVRYQARDREFREPYIAVYGHNFSQYFIRDIRKWAEKNKMPLISVGYRNDWADRQWLTASPDEFAAFMNQAEAVITNFFHGCVFALVNSKPFVSGFTPYRSNKVMDLLKKTGCQKRLITESRPAGVYHRLLTQPLGEKTRQRIAALKKKSDAYLDRALAKSF